MKEHRDVIRAVLIATALLPISGAPANNAPCWPQFRGVNCSGVAAEGQDPPVEFGPEQSVFWKTPLPRGHSSPCIWADHIFVTGYDNDKGELQVFCIRRSDGSILWSRIVPAKEIEKVHSISSPANATLAADGERVYVYFGSYGLLCYDFSGRPQWSVPMPIPKIRFGTGTSPRVVGEFVVLSRDEENDPHLLAVDRRTGKTIWKQPQPPASELGATSYSTPIVWGTQLVVHRFGEVVAYNVTDGTRLWWINAATQGTSTPVIGQDTLFVGMWGNLGEPELRVKVPDFDTVVAQHDTDGDRRISRTEFPGDLMLSRRPEVSEVFGGQIYLKAFFGRVDKNKDGLIDNVEWKEMSALLLVLSKDHGLTAIRSLGNGDVTATHVLWQEKINVPEVPSPLYYEGRVYMINNGGIASCMDAGNGKLLYRERLGAGGPYYSSPICAGGRIYIASGPGVVVVLEAGDALRVLARNNLKEQIFATPAVVDNKLYVRTVALMYAFGEGPSIR
jgi:outer membrane protein assembly factor BamB